jgi:hypothetical protein
MTNLIIYSVCCLLLGYFLRLIGINRSAALLGAVLFAVFPSHELSVAWIAGRGDTLLSAFLLGSAISYLKAFRNGSKPLYFLSAFLFMMAAMTKETAFAAFLLPFLLIFIETDKKQLFKLAFRSSLIILSITAVVILYRYFIINDSLLQAPNIVNINIVTMVINFFLYIPLSVFSPDFLEIRYYKSLNDFTLTIIYLSNLIFLLIFLVIKTLKFIKDHHLNIFFGLGWFIIFIIPALSLLMKWYMFTASIGLIIILASFFEFDIKKKAESAFSIIAIVIIILFINMNNEQMLKWKTTGEKSLNIMLSLKDMDFGANTRITLWAVPDKIQRVNSMKIGIQQAVEWTKGNKTINVFSPLRIECGTDCKIRFERKSADEIQLYVDNARFLTDEDRTRAVIISEVLSKKTDEYFIQIITENSGSKIHSEANIKFLKKTSDNLNLYFDGEKFIRF